MIGWENTPGFPRTHYVWMQIEEVWIGFADVWTVVPFEWLFNTKIQLNKWSILGDLFISDLTPSPPHPTTKFYLSSDVNSNFIQDLVDNGFLLFFVTRFIKNRIKAFIHCENIKKYQDWIMNERKEERRGAWHKC